ncbi:ATP-binding protein [Bacillota bacterium HCP28S3_F12]
MKNNPFTLTFGQKPLEYIPRLDQTSTIIDTFDVDRPTNHVFMISGVRGSGKTVMLSEISSYYDKKDDWFVLKISADTDLIEGALSELTRTSILKNVDFELGISVFGTGGNFHKGVSQLKGDSALRNALEKIAKQNKRVLFVIDKIVNNEYVKLFSSYFQIYLTQNYPVYLIMAGLYDNISNLQNERTLTFLYRAPKIFLEPLSIPAMTGRYQKVLEISKEEAMVMAKITNGYSFAFQILGFLKWENNKPIDELLDEFDYLLASYVYEKVWRELSEKDQQVVYMICQGMHKVSDLKEKLNMSPQLLNVYRKRLMERGIVDGSVRGILTLALPRFDIYVNAYCEM